MNVIIPSVSLAADSSPCNRGSLCKNISRLFLPRRVGGVDAHQDHRHAHDLPQAEGLLQQHHASTLTTVVTLLNSDASDTVR